jgi:hypothetical protein
VRGQRSLSSGTNRAGLALIFLPPDVGGNRGRSVEIDDLPRPLEVFKLDIRAGGMIERCIQVDPAHVRGGRRALELERAPDFLGDDLAERERAATVQMGGVGKERRPSSTVMTRGNLACNDRMNRS